jgi:hypothetical protein
MQELLPTQVHQHTPENSEHPLKHAVSASPQLIPVNPQTKLPGNTSIVFLAYAAGFPGTLVPQQAPLAPEPLAPQASITAFPQPGDIQQNL